MIQTPKSITLTEQTTIPVLAPAAKINFEKKLDWEEFKGFFHKSWHNRIKKAIESDWMYDIYERLKSDSKKERILPSSDNTFKSFEFTDFNKIKVVMVLLDPYPRLYKTGEEQATGIPMDCSNTPDGKLQPSLDLFYNAIEKSLSKKVLRDKSLKYLLDQGVFLINSELTVKKNKTGSHEGLWAPFHKYLFEEIFSGTNGIIYILAGKQNQKIEKYINSLGNYIWHIEHPAAAAHKNADWDFQDIFLQSNKIICSNNGPLYKILWDKKDYDLKDELPF